MELVEIQKKARLNVKAGKLFQAVCLLKRAVDDRRISNDYLNKFIMLGLQINNLEQIKIDGIKDVKFILKMSM